MSAFGKFSSLEAFLVAYEADRRKRECEEEAGLSLAARRNRRRGHRDVVEVDCRIAEVDSNDTSGTKHIQIRVELTDVIETDADVGDDVQRHLASHELVFVAIQYGHGGVPESIPGLIQGADIQVRGVWITAERAHAVGGQKLSVLHYTHSPVGFVMVGGTIYD
jgi:endonuclease G, mitochondrial